MILETNKDIKYTTSILTLSYDNDLQRFEAMDLSSQNTSEIEVFVKTQL